MPKLIISTLFYTSCGLLAGAGSHASALDILLEDCRFPGEKVYLAIYDGKPDGSWQDPPVARLTAMVTDEPTLSLSLDLPPGRYAARAYIDLNNNHELDTSRSDKPLEPFAISVGQDRRKPSSRFNQSIFIVDENRRGLSLTLRYPKASLSAKARAAAADQPDAEEDVRTEPSSQSDPGL